MHTCEDLARQAALGSPRWLIWLIRMLLGHQMILDRAQNKAVVILWAGENSDIPFTSSRSTGPASAREEE
ncbi:hypothetical protein [Methanothrix sp.]|uniref:hypothetical protein n=1 Tax=Methanothrix sp. TaxID=90426 RepID=UPI003C77BD0F